MSPAPGPTQPLAPSAAPGQPEPLIFAMPEKYRHGALPMVEPKSVPAPIQAKPVAPPPPTVVAKPKPLTPVVKKPHHTKLLVLIGAFVLIVLGFGAFFVLKSVRPSTQETAPLPPPPSSDDTTLPPISGEETEEPTETEPFPTATRPGVDADSDGLTDVEERELYGTDPFRPDTDADGFLDGNEVFHRYNPNGTAPATLLGAGLVRAYDASTATTTTPLPYGIQFPSVWTVEPGTGEGVNPWDATFLSTTGERIRLQVFTKPTDQSLAAWYATQPTPRTVRESVTKNGYATLMSDDQLFAVIDGGTVVALTLSYDAGVKGTVDYLQTLQMMLNSLSFTEAKPL